MTYRDRSKYYWPKERVERWWTQGWDWDSLHKKPCPFLGNAKTLADFYGEAFSRKIMFYDPRPGRTGQISEWDYWHDGKDRWLTEFADKRWTPYHLPLYDIDGNLSPKHPDYKGAGKWKTADYEAFTRGLITRLKEGSNQQGSPLTGIVTPPKTSLRGCDETLYPDFSDSLWGDNPRFNEASFGDWTDFHDVTFGGSADFSNATFGDGADFSKATFGDVINFNNATFGRDVNFSYATFDGHAYFYNATFGDWTIFEGTKFRAKVFFEIGENIKKEERSFRNISFVSAEFCDTADFTGRKFIGETDFRGATFHGPARFYEAELPEETYFTYQDANWPLPSRPQKRVEENGNWLCRLFNGRFRKPSDCDLSTEEILSDRFEEYEKAFCRLKKIQLGHEARTAEHFFYKLELKARMRRSDIRWTEKLAAGAYGLFSDYGESIGLPFFWLFVSFLIATAVTCCAALPFWQDFAPDNLGFAATAAWHNLVPGGFIKDVFQGCHDEACRSYRYSEWSDHLLTRYGFWLYVGTGLFAAWNLALWFLFGLALKRRFQIK